MFGGFGLGLGGFGGVGFLVKVGWGVWVGCGAAQQDYAREKPILEMLMAAADGLWLAKAPPLPPDRVGGRLSQAEGGNAQNYYWPAPYQYQRTYRALEEGYVPPEVAAAAPAASSASSGPKPKLAVKPPPPSYGSPSASSSTAPPTAPPKALTVKAPPPSQQ